MAQFRGLGCLTQRRPALTRQVLPPSLGGDVPRSPLAFGSPPRATWSTRERLAAFDHPDERLLTTHNGYSPSGLENLLSA